MNFIILGDRYQKGKKSQGCPGLIKINRSMTVLDHQYKIIKSVFKKAKIIYVAGFEYKKISNFITAKYSDIICINNTHYDIYNEGYSIKLLKNIQLADTLIILGYTFLDNNTFREFQTTNGSQVFISENIESSLGCIINNNQIENISFDLDNYLRNIYYLTRKDVKLILDMMNSNKYYNYFLFELVNKLIDAGSIINPFKCKQTILKSKNYEYSK